MGNLSSRTQRSCWTLWTSDLKYVAAIREPEILDWKQGLTDQEIYQCALKQRKIDEGPIPIEIDDSLMLGSARSVANASVLVDHGVTHVLNVAGSEAAGPTDDYEKAGIRYLEIDADDEEGYPLLQEHFDECHAFIQQARESGGKCVVHCMAGCNRSVTILVAELLLSGTLNILEIVQTLRRVRGNWALSNESFQELVVAFARQKGRLGPPPEGVAESFAKLPKPTDTFARSTK